MSTEIQKEVILICIGVAIGLLPTWINFFLGSWVAEIKKKTGIIRSYKLALVAYVTELEINLHGADLESINYLREVSKDFRENMGLFNKYEIFYFFWHLTLFLGLENIVKELRNDTFYKKSLELQKTSKEESINIYLAKRAYEFLCFAESPFRRPFAYFWFKFKKSPVPNTKAINNLMSIESKKVDKK